MQRFGRLAPASEGHLAAQTVRDSRPSPGTIALLVLLTLAVVLSFLDRVVLGLLIKPIRSDLGLSDTRFSMLFGLIFAGPYAIATLAAGRLADHFRRLSILRAAIMLWSVATMFSMLASSFWSLCAARILVAMGEAALLPCAYSILADRFSRAQLGRAYSVLIMGATVGTGIALVFGSALYAAIAGQPFYDLPLIGQVKPWQVTFLVVGAPGVFLSLALGAMSEPARSGSRADLEPMRFIAVVRSFLCRWQVYSALLLGFGLSAMSLQTIQIFGVQHFVRSHGMSLAQAGLQVGLPIVLLGPFGLWAGGWMNDHLQARGKGEAAFLVGIVAAMGLGLGTIVAMVSRNSALAALALWIVGFFSNFPFGAAASGMVSITLPRARGTITALYTLCATVLGAGLSPVLTAIVADSVFHSENAVGLAVACISAASSLTAIGLFTWARPHLRNAIAATAHG
ncbi:MFS transporter [Novosphingobium sp. HK4-1]|uniref:MFS transporter n=2 Tax=Novosphingobium mangrovi (ex Huang et al. 2023) TaxID=2976432 RepID=A0ABT2I8R8_9SPHN|nr:MFS transporter [Novosphingobium mangrovi (ex Huang et al. 2023)]